ncbi:TrmH family RNA methyltransferase [Anaerotruncus rubiinfantis]|uniref:TrmH family RNA methyltransferase n=1 Tax=Anaerotruncus rubiinfantis TaxID=1720200 RepID=UPI001897B40F|nr:RNA methyltransferase [Anaerotruncus rubiinfantis]
MVLREITSRENPAVKEYVRLAGSRKARRETGRFVTEGVKLTAEAFNAGCTPRAAYVTEEAFKRYDVLTKLAEKGLELVEISSSVAAKLAQSPSPQGVFGVFSMLDNQTQPVKIGSNGKFLLLSSLQDPGNLGTILRTAAAFGVDGVFLSDDCPDLYSLKVLRASMGGVFKVPSAVCGDLDGIIAALRQEKVPVWAAALCEGAAPVSKAKLAGGCAVVIGNEGNGLAKEMIDQCDGAVIIPMRPDSESLNAAMAAGILVWEMTRDRL